MKALACISLIFLSGCATVSMVSKESFVQTEASANSSLLRESSESFKLAAVEQGWVSESRSLMDFANILFGGQSEESDREVHSYAELVEAGDGEVDAVYRRIGADARKASDELAVLVQLAKACAESDEVMRADLISYESALVTAQKSYRSFAKAVGIAGESDSEARAEAEDALAAFAATIDNARVTADDLASAYATPGASTAAS